MMQMPPKLVIVIGVEYGGALGLEPLQKSYTSRRFAELIAVNVVICFFGLTTEIWYEKLR